MPGGGDRRGWVIISRTEALALLDAASEITSDKWSAALGRAVRVLENQLAWIEDGGAQPTRHAAISEALRREQEEVQLDVQGA